MQKCQHANFKMQAQESTTAQDWQVHWSPWKRRVVSALILFHLIAIFSAPFAAPPPSSQLSRRIYSVFQPYLRAVYMSHGYRFFAPNPGPSHLLRFEITLENGETETLTFPDLEEQWPRLLYHRHFMLSESLFNFTEVSQQDFDNQSLLFSMLNLPTTGQY